MRKIFQYNLGKGTKQWPTSKAYNDGKWHDVKVLRDGANGRFIVDNEDIPDVSVAVGGATVEPIETISFGGYPNKHTYPEVTNHKFDGCIDNVLIMSSSLDLRNNIKAYDVTPGCPVKVSFICFVTHQMISFR